MKGILVALYTKPILHPKLMIQFILKRRRSDKSRNSYLYSILRPNSKLKAFLNLFIWVRKLGEYFPLLGWR